MSAVRNLATMFCSIVLSQLPVSATSLPYTFSNGTVADADEVNANFSALADAIDAKPSGPAQWLQLFDRNFTNELSTTGPLNLSNAGIDANFTTGGFSLGTNTVTNDTLTFPEAGHYLVTLQLKTSFLLPLSPPTFGSTYQILFNIVDGSNTTLNSLVVHGMIPNDPNAILQHTLSTSFIVRDPSNPPVLRVLLSNFNFSLAFENKLGVYDIILVAQKWEKP